MFRKVLILAMVAASGPAWAGAGSPSAPVKKDIVTNQCFMPANLDYSKVDHFIPFKTLKDCLKSGGLLPINTVKRKK